MHASLNVPSITKLSFPYRVASCCLLASSLFTSSLLARNPKQNSLLPEHIVLFGDSLSDVGNLSTRSSKEIGITFPGPIGNYDTGHFTDGPSTVPSAKEHFGVWHEQLLRDLAKQDILTSSLNGGTDYAFGGATSEDGVKSYGICNFHLDIDNMGKQVTDYLSQNVPTADTLYIVWGGGNDLLADSSDPSAVAAAHRIGGLIVRLIDAGARTFLIPNLPPIGKAPDEPGLQLAIAKVNAASNTFSQELERVLDQIQNDYQFSDNPLHLFRLDIDGLFQRIEQNFNDYGLENITDKSQWKATVNPDKYLFWDGVHPTTSGHYWIAAEAYSVLTGVPVLNSFPIRSGELRLNLHRNQ